MSSLDLKLPSRIVCLTEETTEWLYMLGQEDRIVGISGYTVRPPAARKEKPRISAFLSAKINQILALKPDHVFGFSDLQADIASTLIRNGVPVTIFNQRSVEEIFSMLYQVGSIVGQSDDLVPADKIIYNLRDQSATVASIPLITASIMSKKLAEGTSGLVMDIKVGQGAFMKSKAEARTLARSLRETALRFEKNIITMITDMSQPLGMAIGNSNEVIESIETLKGNGPKDITLLSIELAAAMIYLAKISDSMVSARKLAKEQITSGKALLKFKEMIQAQGGNGNVIKDYSLLPLAKNETKVLARQAGYVSSIEVTKLGTNVCSLGGGRSAPGMKVDHAVGIMNHVKIGQKIKKGDVLAIIQHHANQENLVTLMAEEMSHETYKIKREKLVKLPELIQEVRCDWY